MAPPDRRLCCLCAELHVAIHDHVRGPWRQLDGLRHRPVGERARVRFEPDPGTGGRRGRGRGRWPCDRIWRRRGAGRDPDASARSASVGGRAQAPTGLSLRRIASYAGALFVIDAAYAAFGYIDILLIGALLDPRSAGFFSAPAQLLIFAEYGGLALAASVGPRLSRSVEGGPDAGSFQIGLRLLLLVQLVIVAPIVVWATPITHLLFGPDYGASADVLRALAPYAVLVGPAPMLALSINYLGEARRRIPLAVGAVTLNAAIDVVLIPEDRHRRRRDWNGYRIPLLHRSAICSSPNR